MRQGQDEVRRYSQVIFPADAGSGVARRSRRRHHQAMVYRVPFYHSTS